MKKYIQDNLFEQYKILIESAEKLSDRRMVQNNIFMTLSLAFLTALSSLKLNQCELSGLSSLGFIVSLTWIFTIYNYKIRNKVKFEIINDIELKNKNFYPLYLEEYKKLIDENKLLSLTTYDFIIATIFAAIYVIIFVLTI